MNFFERKLKAIKKIGANRQLSLNEIYEDADEIESGILVEFENDYFLTGNSYHGLVELYDNDGKFSKNVDFKELKIA